MKAKSEMRVRRESLRFRAMGISNWVKDLENKKLYSCQFYDFDYHDGKNITPEEYKRILEIFPYDCILYGTKHGLHFISFALLKGLNYTKAKAIKTSKDLGKQDYWTEAKDLTLRISDKWGFTKILKKRFSISKKPKFKGILKNPNNYIISNRHLEFYHNYMGLPDWVYYRYKDCDKRDYKIKIYHYKTRD